mmetsp:Transcript_16851/g.24975  ORF Transcript_16851/g.24975 Transcript_16851/m.24975 type:complete len:86 (+) Transcript_16851:898-1155(+)
MPMCIVDETAGKREDSSHIVRIGLGCRPVLGRVLPYSGRSTAPKTIWHVFTDFNVDSNSMARHGGQRGPRLSQDTKARQEFGSSK